jgi:hypothetical protein
MDPERQDREQTGQLAGSLNIPSSPCSEHLLPYLAKKNFHHWIHGLMTRIGNGIITMGTRKEEEN